MTVAIEVAIEAKSVSKAFGSRKALDGIGFSLPQAGFLSIFGPNGAGKTTLLRVMATLLRPSSGQAKLLGLDLKEQAAEIRGQIGFISHRSMLYPDLSAEENLMLAAQLYGLENPRQRVFELLDIVELSHRRHDAVRGFSRGMTQRISIARALIHDPRLVFLDEPYSGLDPHAVEILDGLIGSIRDGRSFVMVSHDLRKGYELSSHILMLSKGRQLLFAARDSLGFEDFSQRYHDSVGVA